MTYRRDFTIGLRETRRFYLLLVLERWRKGLLGFGLAGALAGYLYSGLLTLPPYLQVLAAASGAAAAILAASAALVLSTSGKVKNEMRRSGRDSYVQETEIGPFGIRVTVEKKRAKLSFDRLVRVRETRRAFYLFIADHQAWILPKAQMEDREEECRQIREIFNTVVEKGRLKLKK